MSSSMPVSAVASGSSRAALRSSRVAAMTRNSVTWSRSQLLPIDRMWPMKSSVTWCRATSVTSIRRWLINCSNRSNGPSKLSSRTWKGRRPARRRRGIGQWIGDGGVESGCGGESGFDRCRRDGPRAGCRRGHGHRAITSRASARYACAAGEVGRVGGDRLAGDGGLRELHGAADDGVEDGVAEPLVQHPDDLPGVHGAPVVHGDQHALEDRSGLIRSCTFEIVSTSRCTPRSEKYSAASGMITPCAQASALTVSRPRDG